MLTGTLLTKIIMFELSREIIEPCLSLHKEINALALNTKNDYFDKDGFELNQLEQLYYRANDIKLNSHLYHAACQHDWITQSAPPKTGAAVDHSMILYRYGYVGEARWQLHHHKNADKSIFKLLQIRSKWGLDFSIDWIDYIGTFEIFHVEADRLDFNDFLEIKEKTEQIILNIDYNDAASALRTRRDQWSNLSSDDQSDWKAKWFGFSRAFDTRKVY